MRPFSLLVNETSTLTFLKTWSFLFYVWSVYICVVVFFFHLDISGYRKWNMLPSFTPASVFCSLCAGTNLPWFSLPVYAVTAFFCFFTFICVFCAFPHISSHMCTPLKCTLTATREAHQGPILSTALPFHSPFPCSDSLCWLLFRQSGTVACQRDMGCKGGWGVRF